VISVLPEHAGLPIAQRPDCRNVIDLEGSGHACLSRSKRNLGVISFGARFCREVLSKLIVKSSNLTAMRSEAATMNICAIAVPYDSGHYRGRMGLGPERLLAGGIRSLLENLGHSLTVEEVTLADEYPAEIKTAFALLREVSNRVQEVRRKASFPLVLSGNCNTAVGAVAGCGSENTAVIWFDAHGETTTPETTTSGFLDGMGISILAGQCWRRLAASIPEFKPVPGERIVLVGSRDLETAEECLLGELGVGRASDLQGLSAQLARLSPGIEGVYVHVDLDVLDPSEAVGNQWTPPGGFAVQTLLDAMKVIRNHARIKGLGIASYDPNEDRNGRALKAACSVVEAVLA